MMVSVKGLGIKKGYHISDICCWKCETKEDLTVHHLIRRPLVKLQKADLKILRKQRRDKANMEILCKKCHERTHRGEYGEYKKTINQTNQ